MNNWWENTSHNSPWHPPSNPFGSPAAPPPNPFGNSAPVHGGFVTGDQISRNVGAGQQWATNNAPSVINTAHALLECDRQYRAHAEACNQAQSDGAKWGAAGAVTGGVLGAANAGLAGAGYAYFNDPRCVSLRAGDKECRKGARTNPQSFVFPGRNKK